MYRRESWIITKAECLRNDAFEFVAGKDLRVPWTARRSNQSILKEINPEYSLKGLMLKLNLQCLGHLMWRADSLEKTLMLGKTEGKRRRGWQRMRWLASIINSMDMNLSKLQEIVEDRGAWCGTIHAFAKSWTWLGDWTITKNFPEFTPFRRYKISLPFYVETLQHKNTQGMHLQSPRNQGANRL